MRISRRLITKYVAMASAPIVIAAVGISAIAVQSPDIVISVRELNFTTRASTPNLIAVHTGGFDFNVAAAAVAAEPAFKDFYRFAHVYGAGTSTALSKVLSVGGAKAYRPAVIQARHVGANDWANAVANGEFTSGLAEHFQVAQTRFSQQALFGLDDIVAPGGTAYRGGDVFAARRALAGNVQLVNWTGARNLITGAVGVTETAFDNMQLRAFGKIAAAAPVNASTSNPLGTRVLVQADFTRAPYQAGIDGNYQYGIDLLTTITAETSQIAAVITRLKALVDQAGRSVYDNSMIVLWSTDDKTRSAMVEGNLVHPVSLLIKFPDQVQPQLTTIGDALVSLGQLNEIISEYFTDRPAMPMRIFAGAPYALDRALEFYDGERGGAIVSGRLVAGQMRLATTNASFSISRKVAT